MLNAFTYLPADVCGDTALPDFPVEQDCVSYPQLLSEVCGLIVRPYGALAPIAWYNFNEWYDEGKIDNTSPTVAHFIAGMGSFLPLSQTEVSLAGGRVVENRERVYRATLNVKYGNNGHHDFARQLERNKTDFTFYVVTVGGIVAGIERKRVIGGYAGMQPFYTNALFPFAQGKSSRESFQLILDVEMLEFPEMQLPT